MLLLLAATSALLALTIDRTADEGRQGEAFGALTGAVLIPLIITIVLAGRFEKQRVQERLAASMPPGSVVGGSLTLGYVLFILGVLGPGIFFPESKGGIFAVALLELLVTCLAVLVFVRQARRKEIARLAAAMLPAETAKPSEG